MYGLLLEAIYAALRERYGDEVWNEIRSIGNVEQHGFITHEYYTEGLIPQITNAVCIATGSRPGDIMQYFGFFFVDYCAKYGYDNILKVLGRNMRDFLNGLDNLHEYLRMSYPKMSAPSFHCDNETKYGLTLHYRSKRRGFIHYVMGQIRQVGLKFYDTDVELEILNLEETNSGTVAILQLHFDNKGFIEREEKRKLKLNPQEKFPIKSEVFFKAFPFHLMFGRDMVVKSVGAGLSAVIKNIKGKKVDRTFDLVRPPLDFIFQNILDHMHSMYELRSRAKVKKKRRSIEQTVSNDMSGEEDDDEDDDGETDQNISDDHLHLKGQMRFIPDWDSFVFLGTPILANMEHMYEMNLYINDLSMHDVSRDLVMVGTDRSKELKTALNQQKHKSRKLEEMMDLLDREIKRTDTLLYQMIPREVADALRSGQPAMSTCRAFESVTILFSQVENFTEISMNIKPLEVVSLLNTMYTKFDALTEKHRVYKVETIADSYMVVGGAPVETPEHACYVCDMALDAITFAAKLTDPSNPETHIKLKIGVHSGAIVAGVVGMKMPRYCLFGDTVNTSSRMTSNGQPMKIHISEVTKEIVEDLQYEVEYRGTIQVKGKGEMNTYWLKSRSGIPAHIRLHANNRSMQDVSSGMMSSYATLEMIRKSHMSMRSVLTNQNDGLTMKMIPETAAEEPVEASADVEDVPRKASEAQRPVKPAGRGAHESNTCRVA